MKLTVKVARVEVECAFGTGSVGVPAAPAWDPLEVEGRGVRLNEPGFESFHFAVHPAVCPKPGQEFTVSELASGSALAHGATEREALEKALARARELGAETMKERVFNWVEWHAEANPGCLPSRRG